MGESAKLYPCGLYKGALRSKFFLVIHSAVVLAGGFSRRLGKDKPLLPLAGKPLISHVLDAVERVVDEKIVVVASKTQRGTYAKILGSDVSMVVDKGDVHGPLVGAMSGLAESSGEYTALLPCDTPFMSREVLELLFDLCRGRSAAVPRWPDCKVEPLQAVYKTELALKAAEKALAIGKVDIQAMIDSVQRVRYVSTLVLEQFDAELLTFFNINTPLDLKRADALIRHRQKQRSALR